MDQEVLPEVRKGWEALQEVSKRLGGPRKVREGSGGPLNGFRGPPKGF